MINNFAKTYKEIGNSLKKKRKEKNLTQQQLAELTGKIDRSKISDIENGKEDFLFSTLLKLCVALDISIADILTKKD
ncbi:helix-turn-helix transcriptional regulator [Chryseobacterium sp. ISL-6]|uniref:helix-turn-helix domain-containing protein n=1 Tax=Chryseobacterium sp. ISL-6 TaxID=2819143 RepID=UPI001BE85108|nr:helix-turn-helix transcriptional regulator [Chryseobacterium sp. ISL-6]MBT2623674.1 helix-turn-helix transcriptional regulator [Chryseobacterium sp. ISL-6]